MGSAKVSNATPQPSMAENDGITLKKSLAKLKVLFKRDKKKEKGPDEDAIKVEKDRHIPTQNNIAVNTVANILDKIQKLDLKDDENDDDEDELKNFSRKTVQCDTEKDRIDSQSSEDSGFSEKYVEEAVTDDESKDKDDEVIISLEKLDLNKEDEETRVKNDEVVDALKKLDINTKKCHISNKENENLEITSKKNENSDISSKEDEKSEISNKDDEKSENNSKDDKCPKQKRVYNLVLSRGPTKTKYNNVKNTEPYYVPQQIQINKNTLTGGQVIVQQTRHNDSSELETALNHVQQTSQTSQHEYGEEWIKIVNDVITSELNSNKLPEPDIFYGKTDTEEDLLSCFFQPQQLQPQTVEVMSPPRQELSPPNPIEEFSNHLNYELFGEFDFNTLMPDIPENQPFPTPPHSNVASPMSDSQGSFRTSDYTYSPDRSVIFSPERSSPICNSDYEKFQDISHYDECPVQEEEQKGRERVNSMSSSMTMKQYKDLQKELSQSFSKKDCCQITLKPCKAVFQEHLQKLKMDERKNICLKVAKLELKNAYGVLQNILISLSQTSDNEDLLHALFCLLCERVLSQMAAWFADDFGLNLLKSAVLRCPQRPVLTRYLVQCVRTAIRVNPALVQGRDSVFHEVDGNGDTLVTACARRGDTCADALSELVRRDDATQLPLFRIHHVNNEGLSALHVACSEHSASSPRLHVTHVLLEHAGADLWQGDSKAGDTAVHMAVNSKHCDINLVMVVFKHVDRKVWKKLAHAPNMCSTTPLECARAATKSQRDGYPAEVLEFLKKCR